MIKNVHVEENNIKENMVLNKEESKKMTGFASIDRPWEQYYTKEAIEGEIPKKKIYNYIEDIISKNPQASCYEYFGNKITVDEFLKNVELVAKSFKTLNVVPGEIVSIISPTTPEAIYCVYALNRIGAIANIIDPRLSIENIKEKIQYSKHIVSLDLPKPKVEKAVNDNQKTIYFSVAESFPMYLKIAFKLKNLMEKEKKNIEYGKNEMSWDSFLDLTKEYQCELQDTPYEEDQVAVVVSTSGTSGKSKLAQLTNENMNAVAWQYGNSGIPHKLGDTFLNIMPAFLSYGIVAGIHMPLALGFKNVIIPQRDLSKMGTYLLKYKPQAYLDIPNGYASLLNDPKLKKEYTLNIKLGSFEYKISIVKKKNLSFLNSPGVGGDHLNTELEEESNEFLNKKVQKGYGRTELASAAVVNVSDSCNSLGSVGIPFSKTRVKIVDLETREEVKYNEIGELLVSTPAIFKGYLDNAKATEEEFEYDSDGTKWNRTGDLFSIQENGELFFHGRIKSMIVRPDGHNNHPDVMTELILKHPKVLDAYTVGVDSPYHSQGKYPKTTVVLKPEYYGDEDEVQKELEEMCMCEFSQRDVPYFYEFRKELPYTPNGKVDYRALEETGIENTSMAQILKDELSTFKTLTKKR